MIRQRIFTSMVVLATVATLAGILVGSHPPQVTGQSEPTPGGPPPAVTVSLDAAATGEPISPYIYGMFIEHQGRCIYGGIWAEMIEDRKFYYPVNTYFPYGEQKNKSPWRALPFDTEVRMTPDHAYVGEHSPLVILDGQKSRGIMQDRLALRRGKEYTGRIVLSASDLAAVEISLVWGPGPDDRQTVTVGPLTQEYTTWPFVFTAGADTDDGRLEIVSRGEGSFNIGAVSLMPADNVQGIRADTLQLLRELGGTIYRWPGGTFVRNYNWRDAIGDPDKRPPRLNQAYWSEEVESHDFGPDEFMTLVELVGAEAYIAVSATSAEDVQKAAEEVGYFNGAPDTPMGQWRVANGHPEPYGVQFWGIGNEEFFFAVPNEYAELHNQIAVAMRAVDPNITLIAVGGLGSGGQGKPAEPGQPDWSEVMLTESADYMNLISEHVYGDNRSDDVVAYAHSLAFGVISKTDAHRQFRQRLPSLQGQDIRLALDEWNYSWENVPQIYGEAGPRYPFKNALGIAIGLHEVFRNSDLIFMVNTHAVNVHGHVKTTQTEAAFEVTGLAWMLYRHHFGTLPITVSRDTGPLDISAAWTNDHQYLTVAVVNPTQDSFVLTLDLQNAQLTGAGRWWRVASPDPLAYNEPGQPPRVAIEEQPLPNTSLTFPVPPLSITLYELPAQ
jgi:alpha-N-arabinofuranosidase